MAPTSLTAAASCCAAGPLAMLFGRPRPPSPKCRKLSVANEPTRCPKDCYEIGSVIGTGSFGVVRSVKGKQCGRDCVIKVVDRSSEQSEQDCGRLDNEIEIHSILDHPNIVRLYETFQDQSELHIVMEKCCGGELFDIVQDSRAQCSESEARHIFGQVVTAVRYMHCQGLAHRDIKLENFLIKEQNPDLSSCTVKLVDFGMTKRFAAGAASFKTKCGTPVYMAPEVFYKSSYDERCDIWSCGILLYAILSRHMPFFSESVEDLAESVKFGPLTFPRKYWSGRSKQVRTLITQICRKRAAGRLTTLEILDSNWMRAVEEDAPTPSELLTPDMLKNTRELEKMSPIQRDCFLRVAYYSEDSQVSALRDVFLQLDTNCDGKLTWEELRHGLATLGAAAPGGECPELFKIADSNRDGVLDYTEFIAAVMDHSPKTAACRAAFNSLDQDHSGTISVNELQTALQQDSCCGDDAWDRMKVVGLLGEFDTNQDGEIDFCEFLAMLGHTGKKAAACGGA